MQTIHKLMAGGLGLLLCTVVYAQFSNGSADLQQADFESIARLYVSADPRALVTPGRLSSQTAHKPAPSALIDDRLAVYINLHKTRFESVSSEMPVFARATRQ